jgi:hypothetical protein
MMSTPLGDFFLEDMCRKRRLRNGSVAQSGDHHPGAKAVVAIRRASIKLIEDINFYWLLVWNYSKE